MVRPNLTDRHIHHTNGKTANRHHAAAISTNNQGKITSFAMHDPNGKDVSNAVEHKFKKVKSSKVLAKGNIAKGGLIYVNHTFEGTKEHAANSSNNALVMVGWMFYCPWDKHYHIFWFPVNLVFMIGDDSANLNSGFDPNSPDCEDLTP